MTTMMITMLAAALGTSAQDGDRAFPKLPSLPTPQTCKEFRQIGFHTAGVQISSVALHGQSVTFELYTNVTAPERWAVLSLDGQTPVLTRFTADRMSFGFTELSAGPHALFASVFVRRDNEVRAGLPEVHCFSVPLR